MYKDHLKVKLLKVICDLDIPQGVPVIEFTGKIYSEDELKTLNVPIEDALQVGPKTFIGPSGNITDHINHSCNPNCLLHITGVRAILYSLHVIKAGTELTFDYSTSSTDLLNIWKMNCKCGSYNCRKVISGYQYLSEDLKKDYVARGLVPIFLTNPIFLGK